MIFLRAVFGNILYSLLSHVSCQFFTGEEIIQMKHVDIL